MASNGDQEPQPAWIDEPAAREVEPPGAALAVWASLFGLFPHRFPPATREPRLTLPTRLIGLAGWLLLLLGSPLVAYSLAGCLGAVLEFLAFVFAVLFVARVLRETAPSAPPRKPLGQAGLILAVLVVLAAAWGPVGLFGQETKRMAEARFHLENGAAPTPEMRSAVWWETHSWPGLIATWLAAAAILPASLRLLGLRSPPLLISSAGIAAATGPLLLAVCTALLRMGWKA